MRVLVSDSIHPKGLGVLKKAGLKVDLQPGLSEARLVKVIPAYEALIVRSQTKVTKRVIQAGTRLKVIGRAGVGLDNIDVGAATRAGVAVMNAAYGNIRSAAEHTIALLLALSRRISEADRTMRAGRWERQRLQGAEVGGKVLGLVGIGNVGCQVAKMAQGLGMKVLAHDPYVARTRARELGVDLKPLASLFRQADYVSLHVPLTEKTHNIIDAKAIALMKRDVRLINTARGGLIDESALYKALRAGRVAGAALDVWGKEPPGKHPLLSLGTVVGTPHLGAATEEAQAAVGQAIAEEVVEVLRTGQFRNAVNVPYAGQDPSGHEPFHRLATLLGRLQAQLLKGQVREMQISLGAQLKDHSASLAAAALGGLFSHVLEEPVNVINAPLIAEERGIAVEVKTRSARDKGRGESFLVSIDVRSEKGRRLVAGTVFGDNSSRLVRLDGMHLEAPLEGRLLIMESKDVPGVIGRVGSLLGRHGINIAEWRLGRTRPRGLALSTIHVDNAVPAAVIKKIVGLNEIREIYQVDLGE